MIRILFRLTFTVIFFVGGFFLVPAQVVVNEICSRNATVLMDEDEESSDWIELYNQGDNTVHLQGWWLSDDLTNLQKWSFPDLVLPPDSLALLFASGKNRKVLVDHWETIVHSEENWKYWIPDDNPPAGWNAIGFNDDSWLEGPGGFGRGDGDDNTVLPDSVATVYVRKSFVIHDTSAISYAVLHMDYDDAFVAYLNGVEIARTNIGWPGKYQNWDDWSYDTHFALMVQGLPPEVFRIDMDLFRSIALEGENVLAIQGLNAWNNHGNSSLIPFLSFAIKDSSFTYMPTPEWFTEDIYRLHTNFGLSSDGEGVYLSDEDGQLVSYLEFPYLMADQSFGLSIDGGGTNVYFGTPTPGFSNNGSPTAMGYAKTPQFNLQSGFYPGPVSVGFANYQSGDTIRYTLDGSWVSDTAMIYSDPIFLDSTSVVKARVFKQGLLPGKTATNTFFIGYESNLPVLSISLNPHDLWDWEDGIYVLGPNAEPASPYFGANFWMDWEKPIHVEYFDTLQQQGFELDADMVIHGGFSRAYPQKSLRILTSGKYDQDRIQYQLYPDKEIHEFKKIVLRNSGQDFNVTHFRDGIMHDLVKTGTHNDYQAYQPAVVFLNGAYWGIHNMREKIDRFYINENYGVSLDSIELLRDNIKVVEGNYYHYMQMIEYIKSFWVVDSVRYDSISKMLDIENYSDYFITEIYYSNPDWPRHNTKYWRKSNAEGRWRYILSDIDFGLGLYHSPSINELERVLHGSILWSDNHQAIRRLMTYPLYRQYFINRSADLINTVLHPDTILDRIEEVHNRLSGEMQIHMPRWNSSYDEWEANVQNMVYFVENRRPYMWQHYLDEFNLVKTVEVGIDIDSVHHGEIRINTIIPDILPWQGMYFDGNPIELEAIPDSGFLFSHWSSNLVLSGEDTLNMNLLINVDTNTVFKAWFVKDTFQLDTPAVIISEINYRSVDTLDTKDWIEIWNPDTVSYDLSGWLFRDGNDNHSFVFPEGTWLLPDGYLVLCEDTSDFDTYFPEIENRIGPFEFGLAAEGETLRFYNSDSIQFLSVNYSNLPPWPVDADGTGKTINFDDPGEDFNDGANWYSGCIGGSPGGPHEACDTIAVEEFRSESASCKLFPNPAKSEAFIQFYSETNQQILIELFDFTGNCRFELNQKIIANKPELITIPLENFKNGVYLISIHGSDYYIFEKLIVH
ncbi:MAG: CotH kinase family protein [Bacteroidetes bacterium]|nr:CotH kinase family protein [Bacteroidota bacterium]